MTEGTKCNGAQSTHTVDSGVRGQAAGRDRVPQHNSTRKQGGYSGRGQRNRHGQQHNTSHTARTHWQEIVGGRIA